jgi:hypothetical protein
VKCPHCDQPTIEFRTWCKSPNAFTWHCPHCGSVLRASRATWKWFFSLLVVVLLVVGGVIYLEEVHVLGAGKGRLYLLVGLPALVYPLSYVAYRRGGYALRDGDA